MSISGAMYVQPPALFSAWHMGFSIVARAVAGMFNSALVSGLNANHTDLLPVPGALNPAAAEGVA